jgi:Tol biopolymer transport system component
MREPGTGRQIDDIFAVDRNGMNMKQLTTAAGVDDQPAWSPDGGRIAYRRIDPVTGRSAIWVMNSDGTGQVNLTPDFAATYSTGDPAWSPDGSRIAFAAVRFTGTGTTSGIWSTNPSGSDRQQHAASMNGFDSHPTWSPDGQHIAFTRSYGDDPDITIVTLAGGATRRIQLPGSQWSPAWSPDGRHLAFWQPVGFAGATGIYTVRADGTNVRLHTLEPGWGGGYDPTWIRR